MLLDNLWSYLRSSIYCWFIEDWQIWEQISWELDKVSPQIKSWYKYPIYSPNSFYIKIKLKRESENNAENKNSAQACA